MRPSSALLLIGSFVLFGCAGAPSAVETVELSVASRIRSAAAEHFECDEDQVEVSPVRLLAWCSSREEARPTSRVDVYPRGPGRCTAWEHDDHSPPVEHAWVATGCGYAEQYVVDPCNSGTGMLMVGADALGLSLLDCPTF